MNRSVSPSDPALHDGPAAANGPAANGPASPAEAIYQAEQRRFRRLEASLPTWWCEAGNLDAPGGPLWSLGYTRDLSLGGAKVVVPAEGASRLRHMRETGGLLLLRFDANPRDGSPDAEFIAARIRHVAPDASGGFWVGLQYEPGSESAKADALRAGMRTVRARRKWQSIAVASVLVLGASLLTVDALRGEVAHKTMQMANLQSARKREVYILDRLNRPRLAVSRAAGYDTAFQSRAAQSRIAKLTSEMARLSSENNESSGAQERTRRSAQDGVLVSDNAPKGSVQLAVALPYGYAWPQVTSDLEQLLGRDVPQVVLFRDWKSDFPAKDAREARLRAKTLQITWEPWLFSDPGAVKLKQIAAGKSDAYIDGWAQAAKSFGGEISIRWGHEFNGNWYPWCTANNGGSTKDYIAAYRRVVSRFRRAGAWNARFVWCFNAESVPAAAWNDPRRAYPGDAFVDVIAIDGYNFGSALAHGQWTSFENIFAAPYAMAARAWPNKPLMVGETGCATVGGNKAAWIGAMDTALRRRFPRIESVVWFEADKEADWRMVSSPASLSAARRVWNQDYYKRGQA